MKKDKDGNPIEDEQDDDVILEDEDDIDEDDLEIDLDEGDDEDDDDKGAARASNQKFAAMRVENKKLTDSVADLTNTVQSLQSNRPMITPLEPEQNTAIVPAGTPKTDEEWDALAQKDWKKAVDLRSIQNAQSIIKEQKATSKADATLDASKQNVLAVHPELNDNNSEKARIYVNILNDNPDYLTQPKGPLYAMRDMEDYMENTLGYKRKDIRTAEKAGIQKEKTRQNRIVLNKGSGRTSVGSGNKVVIGKDELEFCKFHEIDPKEYAKNKQKLSKSKKDEVSV